MKQGCGRQGGVNTDGGKVMEKGQVGTGQQKQRRESEVEEDREDDNWGEQEGVQKMRRGIGWKGRRGSESGRTRKC